MKFLLTYQQNPDAPPPTEAQMAAIGALTQRNMAAGIVVMTGGLVRPTRGIQLRCDKGKVSVNLTLTARAANPLYIVIDIERPSAKSVKVNLEADGLLATLLQSSGVLEGEIKKAVAKEVRRELEDPKLQAGLVIDVGAQMDEMA